MAGKGRRVSRGGRASRRNTPNQDASKAKAAAGKVKDALSIRTRGTQLSNARRARVNKPLPNRDATSVGKPVGRVATVNGRRVVRYRGRPGSSHSKPGPVKKIGAGGQAQTAEPRPRTHPVAQRGPPPAVNWDWPAKSQGSIPLASRGPRNRIVNALNSVAPGRKPVAPGMGSLADALRAITENPEKALSENRENRPHSPKQRKSSPIKLAVGSHKFAREALNLICAELHPPIIPKQRVTINPQGTYSVTIVAGREGTCSRTMPTLEKATEMAATVLVEHIRGKVPQTVNIVVEQLAEYYAERDEQVRQLIEKGPYTEVQIARS